MSAVLTQVATISGHWPAKIRYVFFLVNVNVTYWLAEKNAFLSFKEYMLPIEMQNLSAKSNTW